MRRIWRRERGEDHRRHKKGSIMIDPSSAPASAVDRDRLAAILHSAWCTSCTSISSSDYTLADAVLAAGYATTTELATRAAIGAAIADARDAGAWTFKEIGEYLLGQFDIRPKIVEVQAAVEVGGQIG